MTKFCGDSVSVRSSRKRSSYTKKDLQKNMEKFKATGEHPDLERAKQESANAVALLPDHDPSRPFVFLDISISNKPAGRLVLELFQDLAPAAALHLRSRCLPGSSASLVGLQFTKLLRHYAMTGLRSPAAAVPGGGRVARYGRLQHTGAGAVSISLDGAEVAIAFARATSMDANYQVVGRVHGCQELLEELADLATAPDDSPFQAVKVTAAGASNAQGDGEKAAVAETPAQTAERLQRESMDTKSAVLEALQEGMAGIQHKAPDPHHPTNVQPNDSSVAAAAAVAPGHPTQPAAAGGSQKGAAASGSRAARGRMMDSLLDELSDEDGSSSEGSDGS